MAEHAEDVAREAFTTVGNVLFWILFALWSAGWLGLAGIGGVFDQPFLVQLGLGVAGGSAALWAAWRGGRRLLLSSRAQSSLIARATLDGVNLNRDAHAVLGAFDHSYGRALALLAAPDLAGVAGEARADLVRVRERIYEIVTTEMRLRKDVKKLRRLHGVGAVSAALGETERRMRELHDESDRIAQDTQRIAERLERVKQLAAGSERREGETQDGISRVLADLDQTVAAYQEIERERLESAEEQADRLLAARRAKESNST